MVSKLIVLLRKENLNSDGHQFHQYQQVFAQRPPLNQLFKIN